MVWQIVGALGLLANALQSMPIGRLDGGRMCTALFGRKAATFLSASFVLYQVKTSIQEHGLGCNIPRVIMDEESSCATRHVPMLKGMGSRV
jgi:membrane-associated protease RseP (regulator of RpoE activity)